MSGQAHGDREGGAPLGFLALVLAAVVALDAVGRGSSLLPAASSWALGSGVIPKHWGMPRRHSLILGEARAHRRGAAI